MVLSVVSHGARSPGLVIVNPETDFVESASGPAPSCGTRSDAGRCAIDDYSARVQKRRPVIDSKGSRRSRPNGAPDGGSASARGGTAALDGGQVLTTTSLSAAVETVDGERVGEVVKVVGGAAGSVLEVEGPRGQVLIPLAVEICVEIDVERKRIRIAPPEGLLDVNRSRS
jgi:hypothetical protein